MTAPLRALALVVLSFLFCAGNTRAITLGQVDTFEDGTTLGWANGVPGALVNVPTGGPAGANDNYMQLTADAVGSGGRLTTFNLQQWLGNYVAQGVNRLEIDLINQGNVSLSIRFAFKSQNQPNVPGYLSGPMLLPVGSGWQHFSISITAANLIAIGGPAAYNTFFSTGLGDVRIINEVGTANLNGDFVVGQVGIDNIRAVPEPTSVVLALGAFVALAGKRWRRAISVAR
jgi:hypothetical protein